MTAPHEPGTLTTATILFTDVVSSTALRIRLGEERANVVFRRLYELLRSVVTASGSSFTKSLGDGLMAVFDSATAGLDSIIAVQQAVADENERAMDKISIRAALAAGDVCWARRRERAAHGGGGPPGGDRRGRSGALHRPDQAAGPGAQQARVQGPRAAARQGGCASRCTRTSCTGRAPITTSAAGSRRGWTTGARCRSWAARRSCGRWTASWRRRSSAASW
ncbi:hypothetical protein ACFQES_04490 [Nonomuraea salmonea]|uniref:hypothetical protein n=1 Tax=Nonomuraea salmonea TaxID=46181 RepID=UPI003615DBA6